MILTISLYVIHDMLLIILLFFRDIKISIRIIPEVSTSICIYVHKNIIILLTTLY